MTAALDADWELLHLRSRAIGKLLAQELEPTRQIAEARRIRDASHRAGDALGLRALRLGTAGLMASWLQWSGAKEAAQALNRQFAADQRLGIPGLADLEDELREARTCGSKEESQQLERHC